MKFLSRLKTVFSATAAALTTTTTTSTE